MKHIGIVLCAVVLMSATTLKAQTGHDAGQIGLSGGITYGTSIEDLGLRIGATYYLNETMRVGGDFTYWLVSDIMGVSVTYLEVNGHFHYIFKNEDDLMLYGIGALGIHYADVNVPGWGGASDSELALGVGGGVEYNLGNISLFAEPKLFLTGFDQLKLNVGVRYYL